MWARIASNEWSHRIYPGKWFTSHYDTVADADLDVVSVDTSYSFHVPAVMAALEAGKHVLCDKPLGTSVEVVEDLRLVVKKFGRILQVGHMIRFDAAIQWARTFIDQQMPAFKAWYCDSTHRYQGTDAIQQVSEAHALLRHVAGAYGWFGKLVSATGSV